ncbi:MAG TPA: hypothetical protein VF144_11285 [Chitinophagaceae bacterium]
MKMNNFHASVLEATFCVSALIGFIFSNTNAQKTESTLDLTKPGANVSLMLYELMTEEINHSYDSGLYAELIRNRIIKNNTTRPEGWSLVQYDTANSKASMKILTLKKQTAG